MKPPKEKTNTQTHEPINTLPHTGTTNRNDHIGNHSTRSPPRLATHGSTLIHVYAQVARHPSAVNKRSPQTHQLQNFSAQAKTDPFIHTETFNKHIRVNTPHKIAGACL